MFVAYQATQGVTLAEVMMEIALVSAGAVLAWECERCGQRGKERLPGWVWLLVGVAGAALLASLVLLAWQRVTD